MATEHDNLNPDSLSQGSSPHPDDLDLGAGGSERGGRNDYETATGFEADSTSRRQLRRANLSALWSNGRTRTVILLTCVILFFLVIYAYHHITTPKFSQQAGGNAQVTAPPALEKVPGTSKNQTLNQDIAKQNQLSSKSALAQGGSYLPELHGNTESTKIDPMLFGNEQAPTPPPTQPAPPVLPVPPAPTAHMQPIVAPNAPVSQAESQGQDQFYQNMEKVYSQQMSFYLNKLRDDRKLTAMQEFTYNGQQPKTVPQDENDHGQSSASSNPGQNLSGSTSGSNKSNSASQPVMIQAGTVVPGVMITPIDSDAPGPVLVDITTGPFRGSRALCTFQSTDNAVVVHCSKLSVPDTLNIPGAGKTFQINAYLVNADYQTNLATSVNRHTFHNFAFLAASAFVQGYGQAMANQNSQVITSPFGGTTVVHGNMSDKQIMGTALGQVGVAFSQQLQNRSQMPPTIKAEPKHPGEGLACGLLFMSDF